MNVNINGVTYEDAQWDINAMTFETDMSLAEIEAAFIPGQNSNIVVTEGEQEISRYYNKGLESITVTGSDPRIVKVIFDVTQISKNAETVINDSIEISDGAIAELAEIIANLSALDLESLADHTRTTQETINTWFGNAQQIQDFIVSLSRDGGILDQFDARITALEHEVGIVSVDRNEVANEAEEE